MFKPSVWNKKDYELTDYFKAPDTNLYHGTEVFYSSFKTDVIDKGDHYEMQAELPGYEKENIKIDINNDYLTITAERTDELKEKFYLYVKKERSYGCCQRSFHLVNVKIDEIEAEYRNGILLITMPKQKNEIPTGHRIEIH